MGQFSVEKILIGIFTSKREACLYFCTVYDLTSLFSLQSVMDNSEVTYIDYLAWNIIFMLVNIGQAWTIVCNEKPIILSAELDGIWENMFGPDHYNLGKSLLYALNI